MRSCADCTTSSANARPPWRRAALPGWSCPTRRRSRRSTTCSPSRGCACSTSATPERATMDVVAPPMKLTESWALGPLRVPNRVMLAPLAGIGNWFVRLQAKRYGAGMAVSEMVSSHAIHHGNEKTSRQMLRIDPRERAAGPVAIQLFGEDPPIMRSAAARVARLGVDAIDINMGCPVMKVRKTGAGAALLGDPDRAVE